VHLHCIKTTGETPVAPVFVASDCYMTAPLYLSVSIAVFWDADCDA